MPFTTALGLTNTPCEIPGHGWVPAEQARRIILADDSTWQRLAVDLDTGAALQLETTAYRSTTAMRAHVEAVDGTCRGPGCTVPANRCDLDTPWPTGPTHVNNLTAKHRQHHNLRTHEHWTANPCPRQRRPLAHHRGTSLHHPPQELARRRWRSRAGAVIRDNAPAPTRRTETDPTRRRPATLLTPGETRRDSPDEAAQVPGCRPVGRRSDQPTLLPDRFSRVRPRRARAVCETAEVSSHAPGPDRSGASCDCLSRPSGLGAGPDSDGRPSSASVMTTCTHHAAHQLGRRKSVTSGSRSRPADTYAATPPALLFGVQTVTLDDPISRSAAAAASTMARPCP